MNIEHAKSIALREILEKIEYYPVREKGADLWYHSPLRNEKTASFHINTLKNIWYDFGESKGGDSIAFVQAYLKATHESDTVPDALRWLNNMMARPIIRPVQLPVSSGEDDKLLLKYVEPIRNNALIDYLKKRGIPSVIGKDYLKEVTVYHTEKKKTYFALGFKNEEDGYELRNPYFKGCIKPKDIAFIRGSVTKPEGIHIFEGFMDYLSIITQRNGKPLDNDAIILNSLSCMTLAAGYIKGYGYNLAYTWLDNDPAGRKATKSFDTFLKYDHITHQPMNRLYMPHKDVNAWHMHKLGLKL